MRLDVALYPGEDDWIIAECASLPGCITQGRTKEEALANIQEAIEGWLEVEQEKRRGELPPEAQVLEITV